MDRHDAAAAVRTEDAFVLLLRRCALVVAPLGLLAAVVIGAVYGVGSGVSSAIGAVIVLGFFGARLVVMRKVASRNPQLVLLTALVVYTAKVLLLGIAMVVLTRVDWIDGRALGVTVLLCAMVWLVVEMIGTMRLRVPIFGPAPGPHQHDDGGR